MIIHPISPVFDRDSRVLILGSFPSVKSREAGFFYGHPQNRFWKVTAAVFGEDMPRTIEEKRAFLLRNRIAVWDVIHSCEIEGSSDASIRNVVANDLRVILDTATIEAIYVNGKTALRYYERYIQPTIHRPATCLPSTSPANAAWSTERLVSEWKCIKERKMELWDLFDSDRKPLGRTHVRGEAFAEGEYYVWVEAWIRNSKGEFLIQKRHPDKKNGNLWEFVGGGTLAGETTQQSAVREVAEETGILAAEQEFTFFATYRNKNYFGDLYLLRRDVDIKDIVLQPGEGIDARWATEEDILRLMETGEFVPSVGIRFTMYRDTVRQLR